MSYKFTKALELASSEPTAGSSVGTFANDIVKVRFNVGVGVGVGVGAGGAVRYHAATPTIAI
ncbi:MAG: hypothetical protein LZ165_04525 [Thaumarchaeota archaeon]|nr:hypothetical protein [Candidatus Terraquivivens yellowstonensis]